jgi:hypothetical protein
MLQNRFVSVLQEKIESSKNWVIHNFL